MPIFNTLFHSERILSDLAYAALLPALMLNELHRTRAINVDQLPEDVDAVFEKLRTLSRPKFPVETLSPWEHVFNHFVNQANEYLTLTDMIQPPQALLYSVQFSHKSEITEHLEQSKEILSQCLLLLHAIKRNRLAWKGKLAEYLSTVNDFILEQITPVPKSGQAKPESPLSELKRRLDQARVLQHQVASRYDLGIEPGTTVRAQGAIEATDLRARDSKTATAAAAAAYTAVAKNTQLLENYFPAQESVGFKMKEATTFDWLKTCIDEFPKTIFTLNDCLTMTSTTVKQRPGQDLFRKDPAAAAAAAAAATASVAAIASIDGVYEADVEIMPWLYHFASIYLIPKESFLDYEQLIATYRTLFIRDPSTLAMPLVKLLEIARDNDPKEIEDILCGAVSRPRFLCHSFQKNPHKWRPFNIRDSVSARQFSNDYLRFNSTYQAGGVYHALTLFNIADIFESNRNRLFTVLTTNFLDIIRDRLSEQLSVSVLGIESDENAWLAHVLNPLYGEQLKYNKTATQFPPNRKHLQAPLATLVTKMVAMYRSANTLKECHYVVPKLISAQSEKPLYDFLVKATNGILHGYYQIKHPEELQLKQYSSLQLCDPFTLEVKKILALLEGENCIENAVAQLTTQNKSIEKYRIKSFYTEVTRTLSDKYYGPVSEQVEQILIEIGLLAKEYLPKIALK